jgi:hypothetical protein
MEWRNIDLSDTEWNKSICREYFMFCGGRTERLHTVLDHSNTGITCSNPSWRMDEYLHISVLWCPVGTVCDTWKLLNVSVEQNPSSEVGSRSAGQEIPRLLRYRKINYHVQKNLPLVPIPSQLYPIHTLAHPYALDMRFSEPRSLFERGG